MCFVHILLCLMHIARLLGVQKVESSNLSAPTIFTS